MFAADYYWAGGWLDQETVIQPIPFSRFENLLRMKPIDFKWNEVEGEYGPPPEKPTGKHDFQKLGYKFYIEQGVLTGKMGVEYIAFCPRSGLLMCMEDPGGWMFLGDEFQEAYKKWARKAAEKTLLE